MPRPLVLKAPDRKPPDLGPPVRVEQVLADGCDPATLSALVDGKGLRDTDNDGLIEQDNSASHMWQSDTAPATLEFELPEPVPLSAVEIWNYNSEWGTAKGLRKTDVAVSTDGVEWQTVLRGCDIPQADGRTDYDEPVVLQLNGVTARKVRFQNMSSWSDAKPGLSAVVFHQARGRQAAPALPSDGSGFVSLTRPLLQWAPGENAAEYNVLLGSAPDQLAELGSTRETHYPGSKLAPNTVYYWRVDSLDATGAITKGRVAKFTTTGLLAWWKLDEAGGAKAHDASGHEFTGNIVGECRWAPTQGRLAGAMEFDGKTTFINCGRPPELDLQDVLTVSAWIKVREFTQPWQAIVTKGEGSWRLQREKEGGKVMFAANGLKRSRADIEDPVQISSKRDLNDGQWHHLAATYDGLQVALYVDGELQEAVAATGSIKSDNQPIMIGCNSGAYVRRFNGWIDDVRLYGCALPENEIKRIAGLKAEHAAR